MAKVKSHLFSVMRGSVAGITYTANAFCAIVARARTTPTNPSSNRQQEVRASFGYAKTVWGGLTRAIRDSWNAWARSVYLTGPLGSYQVPGRQWFIGIKGLNTYLAVRGMTFIGTGDAAPTLPGLITTPVMVASKPPSGVGYTLTFLPVTTEKLSLFSFISRPFNDTRFFYQGPFNSESLVFSQQALITTPLVITRTDLALGSVYFEHIRIISSQQPTRISQDIYVRATAVAFTSDMRPDTSLQVGKKKATPVI